MSVTIPPAARRSEGSAPVASVVVDEFARANGLTDYLQTSQTLIRASFDVAYPLELNKIDDPDSSSRWIEVSARVRGQIAEVREAHRRYTRAWLAAVPTDKALLVRLAIQIV